MRATRLLSVIVLAIVVEIATAQFHDSPIENLRPKGHFTPIQIRSGRFQTKPPINRPTAQSIVLNQARLRKPLPFRSTGLSGPADEPNDSHQNSAPSGPSLDGSRPSGPSSEIKKPLPFRPSLPSPIYIHSQNVKPVNEESEEEEPSQEQGRPRVQQSHDSREEEDFSKEQDTQNDADDNVPRGGGNGPNPTSLPLRSPASNLVTNTFAQPIHFRPFPEVSPTFIRGPQVNTVTPPPAPPYRPSPKPTKPRKVVQEEPIRQQVKQPVKPGKPTQIYDSRGKKPVAQIIRRYRNDNDDGSITWGFENDDGSYKEEMIGVDCITRGKYGYIDPDGIRREYTYETGIKCDEEEKEEEENGFVDYQENKLVLPDGKTIDLSSMGKKQARRPGPIYRN